MVVTSSLSESIDALSRNPIIVALSLVIALLQLPAVFASQLSPLASVLLSLGSTVVSVLVVPFVFGGMIGLAEEGLAGRTSFDTFVQSGKEHYVSMLGAYLLLVAGIVALSIATSILSVILGIVVGVSMAGALGGTGGSTAAFGVLAVVFVVIALLPLIPAFFVQFFGHAIVLDDLSVVDGYKRSVGLVRRNFLTVAGYFLIVMAVGFLGGILGSVGSLLGPQGPAEVLPSLPSLSLPVVLGIQTVGLLVVGVLSSVFWPFSVSVYGAIRDRTV